MDTEYSDGEILEVFIESVDDLLQSKYLAQARAGGIGSSISWMKGLGFVMGRSGPDRDYVKAILLTLRFFCQDNEPTSLKRMAALIQGLGIDQALKDRFSRSRAEFNKHLDSKPSETYPPSVASTNREIFETFLYGEFAHADPAKRRKLNQWEKEPYFGSLRSQFDLTLLHFISAVTVMRQIVLEITTKHSL